MSNIEITRDRRGDREIDDKYSEAWYELGSPIVLPLLKYIIAVVAYIVDNFFLIKNTYNALNYDDNDELKHPKIIAGCIVGLHLISSILISVIDAFNKDAISGRMGKHFHKRYKGLIFFRVLAHLTLTMKLFRYTTAYLENRSNNERLHKLRMRRAPISEKEIQFVVDQKKNYLVESHYDLVESFFKTVPAALLQVFFMFQTNPDARLRLYSTADQDRFATVFFTIITASIASANYQADYATYKKAVHFQDCFRSGFRHEINLQLPGDICFISNIVIQIATIGIRVCFYSLIIFWSPVQFITTLILLLIVNWFLSFQWNKSAWRFRPVLENPLYGTPWLCFNIIDLWINLFVPGVHYPKPLDHFLNFYTTTFIGMVVFQGFDFLSPTDTGTAPTRFADGLEISNLSVLEPRYTFPEAFQYFNVSNNSTDANQDDVYFIGKIIRVLMFIHEHVTFNQMSYISFFYNVVKIMNIINVFCLLYTCTMIYLRFYDLDFPIQIVNDFYLSIFHTLGKETQEFPQDERLLIHSKRGEAFLVFCMLPNSKFFANLCSIKKSSWKSVDSEKMDQLVKDITKDKETLKSKSTFWLWVQKIGLKISQILYPARFREPEFNWDVSTNKFAIVRSILGHPLRYQMEPFIDVIYDNITEDRRLLLAVFCANFNNIVRHYTSLRLKKTFEFLEIPIEKGEGYVRLRTVSGHKIKNDYEMGYPQRLLHFFPKSPKIFSGG